MNKNIVLAGLFVFLLANNAAWLNIYRSHMSYADVHSNLEIEIRDKVVREMAELIRYQNKDVSKAELIEFLSAGFDPSYIKDEGLWVYFYSLKFEFRDEVLLKVYW